MNVAARGPAGALGRGPAGSPKRAARPFEYGRRASMASLRIGEPPRSRARGPQGPFVQVLNCPPKRVSSTTKAAVVAPQLLPDIALLDPEFTSAYLHT